MQYLEIGQIVNTFGIKGQVKVAPFTGAPVTVTSATTSVNSTLIVSLVLA